uniref:phage portal protein n=1 Tax=Acetatifactor sp. TaxID=1872090 RepID=UPI004056912F
MLRKIDEYPDYSGYLAEIKENGITDALLNKIVSKHQNNAAHTRELYNRYKTREDAVPIYSREPRFKHENKEIEELNNKVNNDFFGEIIDISVGYFAGKAASYKYGSAEDEETDAEEAKKVLSDFVTRNNMYDCNMEVTKLATICGYAGRLFYIDPEGNERVMPVAPYETIILFDNEMTEPYAAIRYFQVTDINDAVSYKAEYYDQRNIMCYEGQLGSLSFKESKQHLFDYCPLQGIPRNRELMGDGEKVLDLIDNYDKTTSDNSNDIEGNTNAHLVFKNVVIDDKEMAKARKSGSFSFNAMDNSDVFYLVKNVNDAFNTNHLARLEDNIYRFSKTPNLNSEKFGTASGISLKFKITGLESKSGAFEAKFTSADTYMYKLLASSFVKKRIAFDPLQCYTTFKRNFPMDIVSEAQTCQQLISAGLPKEVAFEQLSFIDDVEYVMELIEAEKDNIPSLADTLPDDEEIEVNPDDTELEKEINNIEV